jgi:hypothetical protein
MRVGHVQVAWHCVEVAETRTCGRFIGYKMTRDRSLTPGSGAVASQESSDTELSKRLDYVGHMLRELRAIAATADAFTLTYLIDMAILEAAEQSHRKSGKAT